MSSSMAVNAQFFETEGVSHFVNFRKVVTLVEERSSSGDILPPAGAEQSDSLAYEWSDEAYGWEDGLDLKAAEPFFR